jgi:hypothetical protein
VTPLFVVVAEEEGAAPFGAVAAAGGAASVAGLAGAADAGAAVAEGVELSSVAGWLCANADVPSVVPNAADSAISAQSIFLMADAKVLCFMVSLHSCQ